MEAASRVDALLRFALLRVKCRYRDLARPPLSGPGTHQDPRRASEGVARELVEQQHERQSTYRRSRPDNKLSLRRPLIRGQERLAKAAVEPLVLSKPAGRTGLMPEVDDSLGLAVGLGVDFRVALASAVH
jgi:hypothetical protein